MVLPEQTDFNNHIIKLDSDKQSLYGLIYSLGPVKLETFKAYIKIYLKTKLIWSFKSLASALILFDKKLDNNFYLSVDY